MQPGSNVHVLVRTAPTCTRTFPSAVEGCSLLAQAVRRSSTPVKSWGLRKPRMIQVECPQRGSRINESRWATQNSVHKSVVTLPLIFHLPKPTQRWLEEHTCWKQFAGFWHGAETSSDRHTRRRGYWVCCWLYAEGWGESPRRVQWFDQLSERGNVTSSLSPSWSNGVQGKGAIPRSGGTTPFVSVKHRVWEFGVAIVL